MTELTTAGRAMRDKICIWDDPQYPEQELHTFIVNGGKIAEGQPCECGKRLAPVALGRPRLLSQPAIPWPFLKEVRA